jgi:hypothetical protein
MIHVVGGVYDERCVQPRWAQLFGSAGRAAAALAPFGDVTLVTYVADGRRRELEARVKSFGAVKLVATSYPDTVSFDYVHPLSVPIILPPPHMLSTAPDLQVDADLVLRFGMMEGDAVVRAKRAVYDPQSAFSPQKFGANGSVAEHIAVVANAYEIRLMTNQQDVEVGARQVLADERATVVVVKQGSRGALVLTSTGARAEIPAYRTSLVFGIGSGDVFAAAFAHYWGREGESPEIAAELASRSAAWYCSSRSAPLLTRAELLARQFSPVAASLGRVYLAGPFFTIAQQWLVEEARSHLLGMGLGVFSPLHDVGPGPAEVVAPADLQAMDDCDRMLALVDGADPGTLFEVGYARARKIPVIALAQNLSEEELKMVTGSGCRHTDDFATAIYLTAWER